MVESMRVTLQKRFKESRAVELTLPATDYALLDAMDQIGAASASDTAMQISGSKANLSAEMSICLEREHDIIPVNALLRKVNALDSKQYVAFRGLLKEEAGHVPLQRVYDIASSVEDRGVFLDVKNDEQLGRHLIEAGLVPEIEGMTDAQLRLLDVERLGRERREAVGGSYVKAVGYRPGGYMEQKPDIRSAPPLPAVLPKRPDYVFLVNIAPKPKDFMMPPKTPIAVEFPATPEKLMEALGSFGLTGLRGAMAAVIDGPLDCVKHHIYMDEEIAELNDFARLVKPMLETEDLGKLRALAEVTGARSIPQLTEAAGRLDEYELDTDVRNTKEIGEKMLSSILTTSQIKLLHPSIDVCGFAEDMMALKNYALTAYGVLRRRDEGPIMGEEAPSEDITQTCAPQMGGMSFG